MELKIKVKNCKQCPNFEEERMYTEDSFEEPWNWFCKAMDKKKIRGYVEWHEESKVPIPEWCPAKISPPIPPKDRIIVEGKVPEKPKKYDDNIGMNKVIKWLEFNILSMRLFSITDNHPKKQESIDSLPQFKKAIRILKEHDGIKLSEDDF